ncbi:MAG: hypothetical protein ACLRR3_07215 [Eubacterium sp.]
MVVVEHDEDTMRAADYVVDIGPGAGEHGGQVIATGTAEDIMKSPKFNYRKIFKWQRLKVPVPKTRRKPKGYLKSSWSQGK